MKMFPDYVKWKNRIWPQYGKVCKINSNTLKKSSIFLLPNNIWSGDRVSLNVKGMFRKGWIQITFIWNNNIWNNNNTLLSMCYLKSYHNSLLGVRTWQTVQR